MTDDLLKQFTQALAEEYDDGATAMPEASRARIIRTLAERRPRQKKWLSIGIPAFALMAGSTAWAAATGRLDPIVHQAGVVLGIYEPSSHVNELPPTEPKPSKAHAVARSAPQADSRAEPTLQEPSAEQDPTPSEPEQALDTEKRVEPGAEANDASLAAAARAAQDAEKAKAARAAEEASRKRSAEEAAALLAYKTGHDAQFAQNNCAQAVNDYAAYLRDYPGGSFALEASYNRGVCLAKLGRNSEARTVLQPFADGRYGSYRQSQAQALIDALH